MSAAPGHRTSDAGRGDLADPAGTDGARGPAWRRILLVVALLVAGAVSVDEIGDLTQSRPDHVEPGSRSEIVLSIDTRDYPQPPGDVAPNLWSACAGTTGHRLVEDPGFVPVGEGEVRFSVEPGLGPNAERKLIGCLEDVTLDRVKGDVRSVELVDP